MEEEKLDPAQPRWSQTVLHITAELPHGQVLCCVLYGIERVVDSWEIVANNMEILWTLQSAPLVTSCILIEPECGADRHTVGPFFMLISYFPNTLTVGLHGHSALQRFVIFLIQNGRKVFFHSVVYLNFFQSVFCLIKLNLALNLYSNIF